MTRRVLLGLVVVLGVSCTAAGNRVIVAAGTTLVDSGLIDAVADVYEETHPGTQISIMGESTKLILELGRQGAADLLIVHAPVQEQEFVSEGHASESVPIVESRFVLIGPPELAAEFAGLTVERAFARVANEELPFVSRGDNSGTHDRELAVWAGLGYDPFRFAWYLQTGQGMGPTIQVADQRSAVTLAEYGAFLAATGSISLVDLRLAPDDLANPYSALVASSGANPSGATAFLEWLGSPDGKRAIEDVNRELFGEVVYQPIP
ncbi:MAG: substrate-binding domain-containing protein [Acidimicrobiia bacterium]|nr:substrate-binding domain-containing protein [Acidimicrobiia bacterium]